MIIRAEGPPPPRSRYSLGVAGSLVVHALLLAAVLYVASTVGPRDPVEPGRHAGRSSSRYSSALVRSGGAGGDGTGTMGGARLQPAEPPPESWAVTQADRLELKLGIARVIDHLWQSTLFATAVGLLTLAFRRNRARVRYALWFAASVKFLVPFALIVWLGSFIASNTLGFLGPFNPLAASGSFARHPLISGIGESLATTATLWPSTITITEVTSAWLSLVLLGVWTVGFFAIVASRIRVSRRLWDVVLTARRVELIDVKVPKRLQVGLAEGLLEPGVIGWMRPVLLMPADIEDHLTRPEIEAIVAHELCHVRRFDNMTAAIHMVVEAIFWFHPLVWWLGARLIDERERACDEHVLRTVGAPGPYAHGILNVCKRYLESPLASVSGVGSANVRERIEAILANRIGEATGVWKKMLLSALMLCVVIVPMAAGALQPQPASEVDASETASSYALVVAYGDRQLGPGLARVPASAEADGVDRVDARLGMLSADGITSSRLAALMANVLNHPVEDRTGLTGRFNVRLTWDSHVGTLSLQTALQQQLGLQLVPSARLGGGPSPTSR